ncbi:MAG TPA: hypothetical protein VJ279_13125 [Hanamia sp.]|jgi:hypothetical protein|nr:hypothetical protein [Hanamia sp.]
MKFYLIGAVMMIAFSSCLKQSIPDAMLDPENSGKGATLSYEINGNAVNISVPDADNQGMDPSLSCEKAPGYYHLGGVSNTGYIVFSFQTDSLKVGNYKYTGANGETFFTDYNNKDAFIYAATDSMSFNITSYNNGHISGNFSGVLTPMIAAGNPRNTYGAASSVSITKGSFKNVPVFY